MNASKTDAFLYAHTCNIRPDGTRDSFCTVRVRWRRHYAPGRVFARLAGVWRQVPASMVTRTRAGEEIRYQWGPS